MGRFSRLATSLATGGARAAKPVAALRERRQPAPLPTPPPATRPERFRDARPQRYRTSTTDLAAPITVPEVRVTPAHPTVPRGLAKYGLGAWYVIGIALVIAGIVFATSKIELVFIAVFIALVFTSVLWPIVTRLARWMPRGLAVALSLLASFGVFGGLLFYVGYSVTGEWNNLADQFSSGVDRIIDFLENGPLPWHFSRQELTDTVKDVVDQGTTYVKDNAGDLASQVLSNAGAVALIFTILALAVFVTIFFLASGDKMWLWFLNLLPAAKRENTHRAAAAGWLTFSGYARGTMIIAVTDGLLAFILLWILGVPLAAPLALLVLIGAFIPLVGAPAAMVIAMVVALAADGIGKAAIVGIGIALIGQFEGHILQPLVMGRQVSLHPVVVAIGVAAGTFVAGLLGAIIAIPLLAVIWAVYRTLRHGDAPLKALPAVDEHQLASK